MPAVAIKVSAEFAASVREAADAADRSMTGQVEHWAKIGRAAEAALPAPVTAALKRCAGDLSAVEDESMRRRALEALEAVRSQSHYAEATRALFAKGEPLSEADPNDPSVIVKVWPDGTRVRGRLVGREFVPVS